ncbi:4-hydroxybenzoyl-CoA thioesterase [Rhodococcus rhodnii]|nr:acyl-ACP thioesterase domain-containing protein [Rhodococcus rhodnii]TXG91913.1 4-hydroxybenzoyl-CoA thioesterase [Rhodococcus rhodnii]
MTSPLHAALPPAPDGAGFPDAEFFDAAYTIRTGDVDNANRLRLDGIARYLQDVGNDNLVAVDAITSHPYWIVRRTVVDVETPNSGTEKLTLRRWCSGFSTRWSQMRVSITGDRGARIETSGFWINISGETGMPTRISDDFLARFARATDDSRLRWSRWLDEPLPAADDPGVRDLPFTLRHTDIDPFDHVNNAVHWQAVEEAIAQSDAGLVDGPYRAVVEYLAPIARTDEIALRTRHSGDTLTVWFRSGDAVKAVAHVSARPAHR